MADTPALEAGEGNLVEVQVLSPAFSFFDISARLLVIKRVWFSGRTRPCQG